MDVCIYNVNKHVTMKHCSLGARMLTCVPVQRLRIQVAPHCKLQLLYRVCCFDSSEAVELPVPFIVLCGVGGLFVCLFAFFLRTREFGISIGELYGTCVYSKAYVSLHAFRISKQRE